MHVHEILSMRSQMNILFVIFMNMADTTLNICKNIKTPETESHVLSKVDILAYTRASLVACLLAIWPASAQQNPGVEIASAQTSSYEFRPQPTIESITTTSSSTSPSATLQETKSPELWQWKEIFEKNKILSQTNKELAKSEKAEWKNIPGMMDAYDAWLENDGEDIQKTVIAKKTEDRQLDETVIAKKTEDRQLDETVIAKKTEDRQLDETVIALETNIQETVFLTSLMSLKPSDRSILDDIKSALSSTFSALRNHPLLSNMFTAILNDPNCPPLRSEHLVAIQQWLEQNKPS